MEVVDHRDVIAGLTTAQREALVRRSNAAGLRHFAGHLGALAVTTVLILISSTWRPVIMLVHGVLLTFLFTLLHETVHRTPFRSSWLNDGVGRFCGFLLFIEPGWFRSFHLAHHRYTNQPKNDPELATARPATLLQYLMYLSGIPDLIGRLRTLAFNAVGANTDSFVAEKQRAGIARRARIQIGLYGVVIAASWLLGSTLLVTIWFLPYVVGGPFLRAYLLAEHGDCPEAPSMFLNSRTVATNRVVRALAWNMPFHSEHHAFPAVPFHQLAAFHEHSRQHLARTASGYVRFNRDYLETIT